MALSPFQLASSTTSFRFVDVSDKPVEAEVIRNGIKVPRVDIREDLVADFVAPDRLDDRLLQPRVVFQSVKTGERVPRGTQVDIVLSSPFLINADLIAGSHSALAQRSIGEVAELFLADENIQRAVRTAGSAEDLSPDVRGAIEEAAAANDIAIDGAQPNQDFQALFKTIQAAQTFK
jgi:hypothetical protein